MKKEKAQWKQIDNNRQKTYFFILKSEAMLCELSRISRNITVDCVASAISLTERIFEWI